jgi:YfiH family protein
MLITHNEYQPKNIRYGFLTKEIPGCTHRYANHHDNYKENNLLAAKAFGVDEIAVVDQKHTNNVIIVNDYNSYCVADGQVTNKAGIALGVQTADCVPILLADEEVGVIASVHSGWRGVKAGVMVEAVEKMRGLGAKKITAIIGPCIKQHTYEVDSVFYRNFIQESSENKKFFILGKRQDHYMFDLPGYVKNKLEASGVNNIFDVNRNTYEEEENFFSFRRTTHHPDSPMGSLLSVIMLYPIPIDSFKI